MCIPHSDWSPLFIYFFFFYIVSCISVGHAVNFSPVRLNCVNIVNERLKTEVRSCDFIILSYFRSAAWFRPKPEA